MRVYLLAWIHSVVHACRALPGGARLPAHRATRRSVAAGFMVLASCSADPRTTVSDTTAGTDTRAAAPARALGSRDTADAAIARIREHYAVIQRDSARYRCVTRELEGFSAEGGELVACFDGEHLRKLTARHYGEGGRATEEYFVWDDRLEFLFARSERYTAPMSGIVAETEEHRTYWLEDRLIRWIGPGKTQLPLDSQEASTHASEAQSAVRLFAACALDQSLTVCSA